MSDFYSKEGQVKGRMLTEGNAPRERRPFVAPQHLKEDGHYVITGENNPLPSKEINSEKVLAALNELKEIISSGSGSNGEVVELKEIERLLGVVNESILGIDIPDITTLEEGVSAISTNTESLKDIKVTMDDISEELTAKLTAIESAIEGLIFPEIEVDLSNLENTLSSFKQENSEGLKDISDSINTLKESAENISAELSEIKSILSELKSISDKVDETNSILSSVLTKLEVLDEVSSKVGESNTLLQLISEKPSGGKEDVFFRDELPEAGDYPEGTFALNIDTKEIFVLFEGKWEAV